MERHQVTVCNLPGPGNQAQGTDRHRHHAAEAGSVEHICASGQTGHRPETNPGTGWAQIRAAITVRQDGGQARLALAD